MKITYSIPAQTVTVDVDPKNLVGLAVEAKTEFFELLRGVVDMVKDTAKKGVFPTRPNIEGGRHV